LLYKPTTVFKPKCIFSVKKGSSIKLNQFKTLNMENLFHKQGSLKLTTACIDEQLQSYSKLNFQRKRNGNIHFLKLLSFLIFILYYSSSIRAQTYDGYTLYFPQGGTKAYLVDLTGATYHTWTFSSSATTTYASYLLAGGVLLRTVNHAGNSFTGGPISGEVQKVDWNGNILWDYVYSTTSYCSHHDIHAMPNGNVLLIAYERKTAAEATQAGCSQSIEMWPDKIVEIQPVGTTGGNVVWEWHAWDHLVQSYDPTKNNYGIVANHPELLNINYNTSKDWMHMNGIDYNAALDQIVFSSHALNEIYVIDHSTTTAQAASHTGGNSGKGGDFLYRWGNPAAYGTSGTVDFNVVHDAHWVPSDNPTYPNQLCGYNNKGGTGSKTCVDILNPPYNGYTYSLTPGTAYAPSTYSWRYTYSGNVQQDNGNSQQLPNGNTLVCLGMAGLIYELNPSQTVVWSKSTGGTNAQSFRYPPCYITGTYSASASATPPAICSGNSTQLNVTATGGVVYNYSWTSNPPGFTSTLQNPLVNPTVTTVYTATIKNGPCSAMASVTVTVNPTPTATAAASPSSICNGSSTQLNVAVSGGTSYTYSWTSNPAGFTSTLQNPVVSPTVNTTYNVAVTSAACTANSSAAVIVTPAISVTAGASPGGINLGQSSQLSSQGSGGTSYTYAWSSVPAGFTSSLQNPVASPVVTTTYFVLASSGACNANNSVTVTQSGVPPILSVLPSSQNVPVTSGNASYAISSNSYWTASSNQAWCTVTNSGTGNSTLVAAYALNSSGSVRSANITITVGALTPVVVTLIQDATAQKTLNLTLFLEGLYNGTTMNKAQGGSGAQFPGTVADQITVELHNATTPYALAAGPYTVNVNTDGSASVTIPAGFNATYYFVVKHRNSIETWNSSPVSFSGSSISYNFSTAANKAYGNNLKEVSGKFLIFTGDVNQDGTVDILDILGVDNDAAGFATGYLATDTNGDGLVDSGDKILLDNNATNFVVRAKPE
jgi:hypothetical protein